MTAIPPTSMSTSGFPPRRPTRRGGRNKSKPVGTPSTHLQNLTGAMSAGDHPAARSHAFALIRSLPQPIGSGHAPQPPAAPKVAPPKAPSSGRLAQMLGAKKMSGAAAAAAGTAGAVVNDGDQDDTGMNIGGGY